jgi:dihydrodipicolinate synthase/N-acetylneuraminate lyase
VQKLKGIISILSTPFTSDGMEVDYDDLRKIIDLLISEGVHGIALLGVASEFYKISDDERQKMIEVTIEHNAKRVPVVVNITRNSTELAVKDALNAERSGADAIMIVPPYFMPPSNTAIIEHIYAVSERVSLPIMIQYAPQVTGVGIPAETFLEINKHSKGQLYIKAESVPPGNLISTLVDKTEGEMGIFIGNAGLQTFDALTRGASGLMPGSSMTKPYLDIYNEFVTGNKEQAFEMFNAFLPVLNLVAQSAEMFTKFEKIILKRRGIIKSDYCRKPYYTPGAEYESVLDKYNTYMQKRFGYSLY